MITDEVLTPIREMLEEAEATYKQVVVSPYWHARISTLKEVIDLLENLETHG